MREKDFGSKLESIKHIGDWIDGKLVCRPDCPSVTHHPPQTTPDTEWREVQDKGGYTLRIGENHTYIENRLISEEMRGIKELIEHSLAARDTYWKEKLQKAREDILKIVENKRLIEPMDITDETLADIAADTKGEAWMIGYNAAIDNILSQLNEDTSTNH